MIKYSKNSSAFSMIELVFVIVILGIVASISAEVIARTYTGYINQRAVYKASIKTELVATQIVNRLSYAIPGSIVSRIGNNLTDISNIAGAINDNATLEWIGYDRDSFISRNAVPENAANRRPGWSGFIDIIPSIRLLNNNIQITTLGSNLNLSNAIIGTLSAGRLGLLGSGIYFPDLPPNIHNANLNRYRQAGVLGSSVQSIAAFNAANQTLDLANPPNPTQIYEQYKLAWTAYAIVPINQNAAQATFDLALLYNYQPWNGETYNANPMVARQSILLRNVSVFRFTGSESALRFKLCVKEQTGGTAAAPIMTSICKEKVVIK